MDGTLAIGPKEQKVVDTMNRYKARAEKRLKELESKYPALYYEKAKKWADANFSFIDEVWDIMDGDINFKGIKKLIGTLLEGRGYKHFNYENFSLYSAPISLAEFTDDVPGESNGYITNTTAYNIQNAVYAVGLDDCIRGYSSNLIKRLEARQKDYKDTVRTNKAEAKKQDFEARKAKFYDIKVGETPALKLFLDAWKKDYVEYFQNPSNVEKAKSYYLKCKNVYEEYDDKRGTSEYSGVTAHDLYSDYKKSRETYSLYTRKPEKLQEDADLIATAMEADFINSVSKYCEKIVDANLHFEQGKLNGIVTGADGKKWRVETIFAEGPIQRLHLRTLVHEMRI